MSCCSGSIIENGLKSRKNSDVPADHLSLSVSSERYFRFVVIVLAVFPILRSDRLSGGFCYVISFCFEMNRRTLLSYEIFLIFCIHTIFRKKELPLDSRLPDKNTKSVNSRHLSDLPA